MARAAYAELHNRDITLNGLIKKDHTDTYVDEMMSYAFAALGFYFQFMLGFRVPFPFNVLLWPFQFAESYIRWTITSAGGSLVN